MKNLLALFLFALATSTVVAQPMTINQWNEEAKTNIRCLPKYGHVEKTAGQRPTTDKGICRCTPNKV